MVSGSHLLFRVFWKLKEADEVTDIFENTTDAQRVSLAKSHLH